MKLLRIALPLLFMTIAVYLLLPGDKRIIRKNLDSLAKYCSSPSTETAIPALKKVMLAGKLCTDPCRVKVESYNINHNFSKKEFTDHILMLKKMTLDTHFSFHDTIIEFPTNNKAEIVTTVRLDGKTKDNQFTDAYELNIQAEKSTGVWHFSSFTVIDFMEK